MKTFKILFGISLVAILFFFACTKDEVENIDKTELTVQDFIEIGEIHNLFLANAKDNFIPDESIITQSKKIDYIFKFNESFANSLTNINSQEKQFLISEMHQQKNLVKENILISEIFGNPFKNKSLNTENDENLFDLIDNLKNDEKINDESHKLLSTLSNDLKANYEGILTDEQLKSSVQTLINEFNDFGYSKNGEGELVGTILAISISSIEWWEQNPDALDNLTSKSFASKNELIAPWLAADI